MAHVPALSSCNGVRYSHGQCGAASEPRRRDWQIMFAVSSDALQTLVWSVKRHQMTWEAIFVRLYVSASPNASSGPRIAAASVAANPTHFKPSFIELNGILRCGEQHLLGPARSGSPPLPVEK